jgi:hypothetical protein
LASFYTAPSPVSIYSQMSTTCGNSTCHGGGSKSAPLDIWFYALNDDNSSHNTLDTLNSAGLITPGNPEASPYYTAPCVTGYPAGVSPGSQLMSKATSESTTALCQTIYQWILEGGKND